MLTVPSAHLKCQYTAYDTRSSPMYRFRVAEVNVFGLAETLRAVDEMRCGD
ncbi:hypothetical protein BBKW_1755 [Bifidobacterium catenulatum subsp. kashiwanohense JCM 15439 = DSM 21854]|nr:hypothetical protein BBKW_1755 [Bifidobacterium catenulatum subsp. kashiwanohense JCM 15439 = DSM 21854]